VGAVSAIFQRPLCEMGAAYDFAYRPRVGDPEPGFGGPCDDRPHRVELLSGSDLSSVHGRGFSLCPEHESQLRTIDARFTGAGAPSRFATKAGAG
jgi:hypothetical protein